MYLSQGQWLLSFGPRDLGGLLKSWKHFEKLTLNIYFPSTRPLGCKAPAWSQGGSLGSLGSPGQAEALTDSTGLANKNKISCYSVEAVVVEQITMWEAHSQGAQGGLHGVTTSSWAELSRSSIRYPLG